MKLAADALKHTASHLLRSGYEHTGGDSVDADTILHTNEGDGDPLHAGEDIKSRKHGSKAKTGKENQFLASKLPSAKRKAQEAEERNTVLRMLELKAGFSPSSHHERYKDEAFDTSKQKASLVFIRACTRYCSWRCRGSGRALEGCLPRSE